MARHVVTFVWAAGVCFCAAPAPQPKLSEVRFYTPPTEAAGPTRAEYEALSGLAGPAVTCTTYKPLPTPDEFDELARTDAVAALDVSRRWSRSRYTGYRATLHKQERVKGRLYDPEVVRVAVRLEPYAVFMEWDQGAREVKKAGFNLGKVERVLYPDPDTPGQMAARLAKGEVRLVTTIPPDKEQARESARYSVAEGSLFHAPERTWRAWSAAQKAGTLAWRFDGKKPVDAVGRECYVLTRTAPATLDAFLMSDPPADTKGRDADLSHAVTVFIDAQTWLQVGTEIRNAAGEVVANYHFRDIELNPKFDKDQFTRDALKK